MEIEALSNSTSQLVWDYFRTRFPAWLVLSLPVAMIVPAIVGGRIAGVSDLLVAWGMALLLFVEFRLWDDLSDRRQDCRDDPSRVLCQAASIRPFVVCLIVLAIINFGLAIERGPWLSVVILLALHVYLATWYAVRDYLPGGRVATYHAVLLKYPACGWQLALGSSRGAVLLSASLAVVYLGLCMAEVLHDKRLRAQGSAWICLGIELILVAGILGALTARALLVGSGEGNS
jgi:hypothetical protein